jgi:hypothetical protein
MQLSSTLRSSVVNAFVATSLELNLTQKETFRLVISTWLRHYRGQFIPRKRIGTGPTNDPFVPFRARIDLPLMKEFAQAVKETGGTKIGALSFAIPQFIEHLKHLE